MRVGWKRSSLERETEWEVERWSVEGGGDITQLWTAWAP